MATKFSKPKKESFELSPLGAAIVEAMPDRKKQQAIQRNFKRRKVCPVSAVFPTPVDVERFYSKRGESVQGV